MTQRLILTLACAAGLVAAAPAWSQTNVGVSVSVNQPGVYGRIDIGNVPTPPALVYAQPVVVAPQPVQVVQQPIYLHVPPGHSKHWKKHCHRYDACGRPVYFVQEQWYQTQYVPVVQHRHRDHDDDHGGRGRGGDHGHGGGHGHGHGHGKHRD